jgi:hypothetical protein
MQVIMIVDPAITTTDGNKPRALTVEGGGKMQLTRFGNRKERRSHAWERERKRKTYVVVKVMYVEYKKRP